MDEFSAKRGIDGVVVPRKGMEHVFRDTAKTKEQSGQMCSRLGCSSRVNAPKVTQFRSSDKGKTLRYSIQSSSSGKEAIGSSSRNSTNNPGKPLMKPRKKLSACLETDSSETSEISAVIHPSEKNSRGLQAEVEDMESSNIMLMEVGSSSVVSNSKSQRNFHQKPALRGNKIKNTIPFAQTVTSRYGLRNIRCNSSDVIPAGCSSSDSSLNRRKDAMKKRISEGESSSNVKGKKIAGSLLEGQNSSSQNGISISDSRRSRNVPPHRDSSIASVRTQRTICSHARGMLSNQVREHPMATDKSPVMVPLLPHSSDLVVPGISYRTSSETPFSHLSSYSIPGTSNEQLCDVTPVSASEYGITHPLINRDSFRRYNMDGVAEMLLALERFEQNEELTHEQILLLETGLFLNGLNFHDHHRDMRLDIDNMSYEELLALEERMGTVSTALTEEALSECLGRSIYGSASSDDKPESCTEEKDGIKCCICQEEYAIGVEVGSLQCKHRFHMACIQQWLRLKNWCPVCKVSAAPFNLSAPS